MSRDPTGVTVVVPTRGRPGPLDAAVASIIDQDYGGQVDVLVVFDREPPRQVSTSDRADRCVESLANTRAPGPAGARNTGILVARQPLLALCDDDDTWRPDKLRRQVEALQQHPTCFAVTSGLTMWRQGRGYRRRPPGRLVTREHLEARRQVAVHTSTLLFARERLLDEVGLIDESIPAGYGEDYDWLLRCASVAPLVAARETLVDVAMGDSWFADRWALLVDALCYQLERRPELSAEPRNRARIEGRVAFAHAALDHRAAARSWAMRSVRSSWREPRGYLALAVTARLLSVRTVTTGIARFGRSV